MTLEKWIHRWALAPRSLFLLDGLGALLSALLLSQVLARFPVLFGMPRGSLYVLAAFPCLFALYDGYVYLRVAAYRSWHLRVIAFANLGYCAVSAGFLFLHRPDLTTLGWTYFLLELAILIALIRVQLRVAARL